MTPSAPPSPPTPPPEGALRLWPDSWVEPFVPERHFAHPQRPLEIDVGFGKGRFLLARAARHPEVNYLGIERLLGRLRKVERKALRRGLDHVRLLRMEACYAMAHLVPAACARAVYIFFPDPWPKKKHHKYRLMSPEFVDSLHRVLAEGGRFHFATDHAAYFAEVMESLAGDRRFRPAPPLVPDEEEQSDFERLYLGVKPINRAALEKV